MYHYFSNPIERSSTIVKVELDLSDYRTKNDSKNQQALIHLI